MEISHSVAPSSTGPTLAEEAAAMDAAAAAAGKTAAPTDSASVAPSAPAPDPNRPAWLPEQFKSPEDMAKAYKEAQAKITELGQAAAKPAETVPPTPAPTPAETPTPAAPEAAKAAEEAAKAAATANEVVAKAGLDMAPFQAEWTQTGDISDATRTKIADGLKGQLGDQARAMVDQFIDGQKAVASNRRTAGLAEVGGEKAFTEIANWARNGGMTKEQLGAFNTAVESSDMNTVILAMRGIKATFEKANGRAPTLVNGSNQVPGAGEGGPFASTKQMVDAINDPRYAADPAYRKSVENRMKAAR